MAPQRSLNYKFADLLAMTQFEKYTKRGYDVAVDVLHERTELAQGPGTQAMRQSIHDASHDLTRHGAGRRAYDRLVRRKLAGVLKGPAFFQATTAVPGELPVRCHPHHYPFGPLPKVLLVTILQTPPPCSSCACCACIRPGGSM
jgi:hypothetical protein